MNKRKSIKGVKSKKIEIWGKFCLYAKGYEEGGVKREELQYEQGDWWNFGRNGEVPYDHVLTKRSSYNW